MSTRFTPSPHTLSCIHLLICSDFKKLYNKVRHISAIDPHILRQYKAASNFVYEHCSSHPILESVESLTLRYGEAMPNLVHHLVKTLGINKDDVFYDVGSGAATTPLTTYCDTHITRTLYNPGIGNVAIQVAAQTGAKCYGIEIRDDLHDLASVCLCWLLRCHRFGSYPDAP